VHFLALAGDADGVVRQNGAWRQAKLRVGRIALTTFMLLFASLQGWAILLAAMLAWIAARQIVLYRLEVKR
ncbi:ATP synthase subunit I, partial [Sphingomonas koreensis]|uniref:ATP synthase subunit I n=2 Tax=Alphaproteobacteria TaxID=28211 RepID=UPI001001CCCD